jgi:hypothetical protein
VRWWVLYARSRRLGVTVAAMAGSAVALLVLGHAHAVPVGTTLSVTVASAGLVGADAALDRVASIRWPPRRAAHLIGIAVLTGLASLPSAVPPGAVVRDALGQAGLAGVGVTLFGESFGWCLPFAALVVTYLPGLAWIPAATWLAQPAGSTPALVAAIAFGVTGLLSYSAIGCRRV